MPLSQNPTELQFSLPDARPSRVSADSARRISPWDSPYALEIAGGAVAAREYSFATGRLRNFTADAEGHIYFQGDIGDRKQTYLVRADQVALKIAWTAAAGSQQIIIGRRSERFFPEDIRYHIDHLSVLLDNLGDSISLGEGTEVKGVLHPAAPGALDFYEYRLVDSMEIGVAGRRTRLYKLEVRPRDLETAGLVGTMFVERNTRAIPQMSFTFTPAAYVDDQIDYILVTLEAALWEGEYWLPSRQRQVIRRQVRWLDFPVGGVIQTDVRVSDYRLNTNEQPPYPYGGRIVSLPDSLLREYHEWHSGLYDGAPERWEPVPTLADVSREAREIVQSRYLGGRSRVRLYVPGVSSVLRSRRAEGWLVGGGLSVSVTSASSLTGWVGYPFGRQRAEWQVGYQYEVGTGGIRLRGYQNRLDDIGPFTAAAGVISTLGFELRGDDYTDPYFAHGGGFEAWWEALGGRMSGGFRYEEQASAELVATPAFEGPARPVRTIQDGRMFELEGAFERSFGPLVGLKWVAALSGDVGWLDVDATAYTRWLLRLSGVGGDPSTGPEYVLDLAGGVGTGTLPAQRMFLLGGRQTTSGYDFRAWTGDRVAYAAFTYSLPVVRNWLRLRLLTSAGWSEITSVGTTGAAVLGTPDSDGIRASAGGGVGLFFDLLRVDAARGFRDGIWEWMVSVNPAFWPAL